MYEYENEKHGPKDKVDQLFDQLIGFNYGSGQEHERSDREEPEPEPAGRGDRDSKGDEPREGEPGPEHAGPEPASSGDDGGGYAPSYGGDLPSYDDDLAMMRAEQEHIDTVVIPHYELLIAQAETAGNGPRTLQALRAALEAARESKNSGDEAIDAVTSSSEAVKTAYDNAAEEAATEKDYFHGDG